MTGADTSAVLTSNGALSLGWSCDGGLLVLFSFGRYIRSVDFGAHADVQYRFDDAPPLRKAWWFLSRDHRAVFLRNQKDVVNFTKSAARAWQLVLRVFGGNGEIVTGTFNLSGLPEALSRLRCAAGIK
jgi:hypothetical protein